MGTPAECEAREVVLLEHYTCMVDMECKAMIEMIQQHVIPAAKNAGVGDVAILEKEVQALEAALKQVVDAESPQKAAALARTLRLETMEKTREACDAVEALVPPSLWTLASYRDLLFLDSHKF